MSREARPAGVGSRGVRPGVRWRWARRATQALALAALVIGPVLGGWQRLDYTRERSTWSDGGWNLPSHVQDLLPLISTSDGLYRTNQAIGGGIAAELFSIPFMDPLAGALALLGAEVSLRTLLALGLPIALALVGGRVFCGWFCAFGTLSRLVDAVCARLPHYRFFALPRHRWLRWLLLAAAVLASLFGSHLVLYLLLPYLLLQQSVHAAWLLGGGSAVFGVLAGLLGAGLVFGPTVYCASLCPTGATLSLLGRRRALRLVQAEPAACGKHCDLCDRACWLQLDPSSGDPGPDCDLCARCVPSCPQTNLRIARSSTARSVARATSAALLLLLASAPHADAQGEARPVLVLDAEVERGRVTLAVSAIDFSGRAAADTDWLEERRGVELSVYVARGELRGPAADGIIPLREAYRGPLRLQVLRPSGEVVSDIEFPEPNSPISAARRRIYRTELAFRLLPGDRIRVAAVSGWIDEPVELAVPTRGTRVSAWSLLQYFAVSMLLFSGLLSLAFVSVGPPSPA